MVLIPLPAFADNYIWLLHHQHRALVVDPGDAQPVLQWLQSHPGVQLDRILVTHHHADHTGGLQALVQATGASVSGPAMEKLPVSCEAVSEGHAFEWGPWSWHVIDVPGHTAGHVAYWGQAQGESPLLFCGDTLFSAGCGRLFEGTAAQMLDSLDRLAALPADTRVCCAHEYTLSNLRFARVVEPDNTELARHESTCIARRSKGQPTLPATLGQELMINPFLRSRHAAVRRALQQLPGATSGDDAHFFGLLREWKNQFR